MSSPTFPMYTSDADRELVVVYPSAEEARAAADRLLELDLGLGEGDVRIGEEPDEIVSLRAEMHEELTQGWIVPTAGVVATKESVKGTLLLGTIASAVALVIAVPLAFIDYGPALWIRLATHLFIALTFGSLVGFLLGGARNAKPPNELMAAQRGTVLWVGQDTPAVRDAVLASHPIRVDEVGADGTPLDTLLTEGDSEDVGVVEEMRSNLQTDGYHVADDRAPEADADADRSEEQTDHR